VPIVGLVTLLLVNSVISRFLFRLPIVTSIEITRIAFVWAAFLGVALVSLASPTLGVSQGWLYSAIPVTGGHCRGNP
jgi:TRAP-type C4-dicarboxylate transport system permease small subunit